MGFFEILLIAVVTLFVVGPERMPEAVRSVALTIGRIKRSFNSARSEIERQIGADEIRRELHNDEVMYKLGEMESDLSEIDKKIHNSELDMPWTEDEYLRAEALENNKKEAKQKIKNQEIDQLDESKESIEKKTFKNINHNQPISDQK